MSLDGLNLTPDSEVLATIFPDTAKISTTILSSTIKTCTFIAHLQNLAGETDEELVVHLELSSPDEPGTSITPTVSALQSLAALAIPGLVPFVLEFGTAIAEDGRTLAYSATTYFADTVALDSVWGDLPDSQRGNIASQVSDAMAKIQNIDLRGAKAQAILRTRV
ncbi:hypothetical protein BDW74DRAFT_179566 [Aspergillus multicolor]|uniref:uncharacterized protein n=1 Tax=Aspergillus multicolor TaxID=41759 RepID=UPI003CCDD1F1